MFKQVQNRAASEFIFQVFALIASLILVHALYVTVIRPNANAILEQQLAQEAAG